MSEQNHQEPISADAQPKGRRRLLKVLALGGVSAAVVPEKWVRPVIDAVIVPAHAQGSIVRINGIYSNGGDPIGSAPGSFMERLANLIIPAAHALPPGPFGGDCVTFDCTGNPVANVIIVRSPGTTFSETTEIRANNTLADVNVAGYQFFELSVSASSLRGKVVDNVVSQGFILPLSGPGCVLPT